VTVAEGVEVSSETFVPGFIVAFPLMSSVSGLSCVEDTDMPVLVIVSVLLFVDIWRPMFPVSDRLPVALSFVLGDWSVMLRPLMLVVPDAVRLSDPDWMLPVIVGLSETCSGLPTIKRRSKLSIVPVVVSERFAEPEFDIVVDPTAMLAAPDIKRLSVVPLMLASPTMVMLPGEM